MANFHSFYRWVIFHCMCLYIYIYTNTYIYTRYGADVAQAVKRLPEMRETWVRSLGREDPWRRKWQPTPIFLPRKFCGLRSLVGYSPWGCKESDTTERLRFALYNICYVCVCVHIYIHTLHIYIYMETILYCWWKCKLVQPLWKTYISMRTHTRTYTTS